MRAIMLAAGRGIRLLGTHPPKILLEFGGKSLLARHIEILQLYGITQLSLGVGYHRAKIDREIAFLGAEEFVKPSTTKILIRAPVSRCGKCGTSYVAVNRYC